MRLVLFLSIYLFFWQHYKLSAQVDSAKETVFLKIDRLAQSNKYDQVLALVAELRATYYQANDFDGLVRLYLAEANALRGINDYKQAEKRLLEIVAIAERHLHSKSSVLMSVYELIGDLYVVDLLSYEKGLFYYEKSLALAQHQNSQNVEELVIAYNNVGITNKTLGEFDKANNLHKQALELVPKSNNKKLYHNTLYYLGDLKLRLLEYDSAKYYFDEALVVYQNSDLPKIHTNLADTYKGIGWIFSGKGNFEEAINYELKALEIYEQITNPVPYSKIGTVHLDISYEYQQTRDYDQALLHANQALSAYQKIYKGDHPRFAAVHNMLGRLYYNQCQYFNLDLIDKSIEHYEECLRIDTINYPAQNTPFIAVDYHGLGLAYKWAGQYRNALDNIMKTLKIQEKLFGDKSIRLINTINNLGAIYVDLKDYDSARYYFNLALKICEIQSQSVPRELLNIHKNFADISIFEENYQEALNSIDRSLAVINIIPDSDQIITLPQLDSISFKQNLMYLLPRRSKALLGLYKHTNEKKYLHLALNNDLQLTIIYEDIIQNSKSTEGQLEQLPNLVETYENTIFCQYELMKITGNEKHKEVAFNFAERSKAILLTKNIRENQKRKAYNLPVNLLKQEDSLRRKMNALSIGKSLLAANVNFQIAESHAEIESDLLKTRNHYQNFKKQLQKIYPDYNKVELNHNVAIETIQEKLNPTEALLEYVVGDNHIFIFLITKNSLNMIRVEEPKQIAEAAEHFRKAMLTRDIALFADNAHLLYQKLFFPVEKFLGKEIDKISIVSDGFLSYVPFEALIRSEPKKLNYKTFDYLLHDYCVTYNYSASLKMDYEEEDITENRSSVLALAPVFSGEASQKTNFRNAVTLSELPFANQEVKHVMTYMPGKQYVGTSATETQFREAAPDYQILHLATHALTDDLQPKLSRLYFSGNDSTHDGLLHAYELYNMDLKAKLVTLSACNTGVGKFYKGEGIASLARAFRYAGCKNIVMSLWAVADRSTSEIMNTFYKHSGEGMPISEALREAKLQYLKEADVNTADPFYWAGFTITGQNEAISEKSTSYWYTVILLVALALIIVFIKYIRA